MVTDDQGETLAALGTPSIYGHDGAVERIDTHSATVFLVGDRAYKLKRAVRFDYLDFSNQQLRRAACEAELALNRRTAPDLYLRVVPVTREADGTLALAGGGQPVDWLVEMRRFDQDALLDRRAARHRLDVALMPQLADAVADLHVSAERVPTHGGRAGMQWVVDGNAEGFAEHGRGVLDQDECARLTRMASDAIDAHARLLDDRRDGGFVRRCHGDLHLRNIFLADGRPTLFDAIEFNDEISCIDVLYDLAFLLMDLVRRDLRGHANLLLGHYLPRTDDLDGLALLPLFLSCRAAVRAKTSVTARTMEADEARRSQLAATSRDYLALADAFLQPAAPRLLAIGGFAGSGKSGLAARLAPGLGAAPGALVLRSDAIRKAIMGVGPETRLAASGYTPEVTSQVYATIVERAGRALRAGHSVIADAVFADPAHRRAVAEAAPSAGASFTGLWLDAPSALLAERIAHRTGDVSDATVEVLERQLARGAGDIEWARVDASGTEPEVQRRAEELLSMW
jgi:aminoglycoside phosphotransferase family enzyme/predicted kinase